MNYTVELFPLIIVLAATEGLTWLRRKLRVAYLPPYFAMWHSEKADEAVAAYYLSWDPRLTSKEVIDAKHKKLRATIVVHAIVGFVVYTFLCPLLIAGITVAIMPSHDVIGFVFVSLMFQAYKVHQVLSDWEVAARYQLRRTKLQVIAYAFLLQITFLLNVYFNDHKYRAILKTGTAVDVAESIWSVLGPGFIYTIALGLITTYVQNSSLDTQMAWANPEIAHIEENTAADNIGRLSQAVSDPNFGLSSGGADVQVADTEDR